jgi:hypothetical protein
MHLGTSNPQLVFPMTETEVSIRIDLESGRRISPGKIALLEAIRKTGCGCRAIDSNVLCQSVATVGRAK